MKIILILDFLSVALIKYPKKYNKGERDYFGSQFQGMIHHDREAKAYLDAAGKAYLDAV